MVEGERVVEGRGSGGEGVVVLGPHRCSCVVALDACRCLHMLAVGTHSHSHMVVLGPCLLASLVQCCRPRVAVSCLSFVGE